MKGALNLGKLAGIKVWLHWSFLLLVIWIVIMESRRGSDLQTILISIAFILVIFFCIVLHELGHALTARRYGIQTKKITLLPIGGVASLEKMPEDPKQELLVALAGPAVNLVIAFLLYFFVAPLDQFIDPENPEAISAISGENFVFYLFFTNIFIVIFNAIPAFPMDGGRVLRALLSFTMDRVKATQIAASLGQVLAIGFFLLGLFSNPFLILIAIFIFFGASGEFTMVQHLAMLRGFQAQDAMLIKLTLLHPEDSLQKVGDVLLASTERNFIVTEDGQVVGILYHSRIIQAFKEGRKELQVRDLMDRDVFSVSPAEKLTEVYRKAQQRREAFFPVLQHGELLGSIDMENINEFMIMQGGKDY